MTDLDVFNENNTVSGTFIIGGRQANYETDLYNRTQVIHSTFYPD